MKNISRTRGELVHDETVHVFVDYENIKRIDPGVFAVKGATFTLLLGPQNRTLDVALVEQLMAHAVSIELVRLAEPGRNAVDFALAYYLGRKVVTDPAACFYLVSKDTGYDPLIVHLRSRNVRIRRLADFESLMESAETIDEILALPEAAVSQATAKSSATGTGMKVNRTHSANVIPTTDPLARVLAHLRKNANSRPRRKKTLMRQLTSQFFKGTAVEEIEGLIHTLVESGHLKIDSKGGITYQL